MRFWISLLAIGWVMTWMQASDSKAADEPGKALRHIVLYKFKDGLAPEKVQEVVDAFAALPKKIDTIIDFEHGTNVSPEGKSEGLTHCFVVTFRDEKGRDHYLEHPAHLEYVKIVRERREKVVVFDYWTEAPASDRAQAVIDEVDKACRERTIYMIGPEKARRLAELVRQKQPRLVVECGTAIGYSGLWIARELKAAGKGKLITIEIDADRAEEAQANFARAGLGDYVEVRVGDAREEVKRITGPVDFALIDCNYPNYRPCYLGLEGQLADGAVLVADNVGVGASSLADYLEIVRSKHQSKTEWFDIDLPWGKRDAMEITIIKKDPAKP